MTPKPPLPLEGEGVGGWGVGTPPTNLNAEDWFSAQGYSVLRISNRRVIEEIDAAVAQITKAAGVSLPTGDQPAHTPSQPFPLEGKGFSEV